MTQNIVILYFYLISLNYCIKSSNYEILSHNMMKSKNIFNLNFISHNYDLVYTLEFLSHKYDLVYIFRLFSNYYLKCTDEYSSLYR